MAECSLADRMKFELDGASTIIPDASFEQGVQKNGNGRLGLRHDRPGYPWSACDMTRDA